MDSESESTKSHTESEEDIGCYFLQPASSPYNITEKVHQANVDLYNLSLRGGDEKQAKVKFRKELVSFEPDSTDDDINSIESDQGETSRDTPTEIQRTPTILEHKPETNPTINIFEVEDEDGEEFQEEEVVEDTESETEGAKPVEHLTYTPEIQKENVHVIGEDSVTNTVTESSSKRSKRKKPSSRNSILLNPPEIHCKDHCIDKLDFDLSTSIKRLEIDDKPHLPPLQLLQRKCCDKVKERHHINLPNYKGLRSEYGLTSRQLDKKEKQAEMAILREEMRGQLLEEYRQRKIQQNEKVFMQWLKEVAKRKSGNKNSNKAQNVDQLKRVNTDFSGTTTKTKKKVKRRPKTAERHYKRTCKKRSQRPRPHTAHSCVYIEIPQSLLEQGLNIGDLTITSSKLCKKLHILAVS